MQLSDRKLKVLVLPSLFPAHDVDIKGIFILDYVKCIQPFCDVTVFVIQLTGTAKGYSEEIMHGIKVCRLTLSAKQKIKPWDKIYLYLLWFLKGYQVAKTKFGNSDIIHVHGSVLYGNLANRLYKTLKIPYIITEHTGPFSKISGNKINRFMAQRAWNNCKRLLTVSNDLALQIKNTGMYVPELKVTYNPVNTDLFTFAKKNKLSSYRTITFAARLENYKGGLRTLKAFHKSNAIKCNYKLLLMGDGPEMNAIKNYIEEHHLQNCVQLSGNVSKQIMVDAYQHSSFFVFPSEHETFGLVIAEAMACGLPVITSNITAPAEQVDKENGLTVNPFNIVEITDAINTMMQTIDSYDSYRIREKVIEKFGFKNFGKQLHIIYKEALK